ncbi:hypothetical protein PGB90_006278 [Kerria lacca]
MIGPCLADIISMFFVIFANGGFTNAIYYTQCTTALGMESGAIRDEDIAASSSFDNGNVGPQHGRIRTENHGGAWCPKQEATPDPKEWLEINLHQVHVITAVETQGRFGNGQGQEYTEAYQLEYWRPKLGKWKRYRNFKGEEIIAGNENTYLEAKRILDPPMWASKIRFVPYSYHRRTVCMRVELYGCYWIDEIISYSMPQGDKRSSDWEFYDATYDGYWNEELQGGLGQLTDGKIGAENFKMGYYDYERNQGWVGWRNDSRNGQPIEIKFEFNRVREFAAVHIYTNNQFTKNVQVFSKAEVTFSMNDRHYFGDPITYTYMEDKLFESSRNVTIKLHRRVGRFLKLILYFGNQWIMISEIIFDSDVAHGNFTLETNSINEVTQYEVHGEKEKFPFYQHPEIPVSTTQQEDQTYMAIIIGILMAVIILLAFAIVLIVVRHRQRKCFASPLTTKSVLAENHQHLSAESSCGTYSGKDGTSSSSGLTHSVQKGTPSHLVNRLIKIDDYQEPYQALRYAPYYSYSSVIMEMRDTLNKSSTLHIDSAYDYAVPETGTMPLLSPEIPPSVASCSNSIVADKESLFSRSYSSDENKNKKSLNQQEILSALRKRLEHTTVAEFPRHRLRILSRLGEGSFGTIYVAEADGIMEYDMPSSLGKRLVAVKFLTQNAGEKEKVDFHRDVRILAALEDVNIARVLGVCTSEEPLCVIMEYLDHGDLNQFLKTHVPAETIRTHSMGLKTLSFNCLLYIATQIASGMRYLESLNFVHRDLATRNCLIGKAYQIKISDFGTDNELYASDYYKVDSNTSLPLRWMAWESVFLGKYTTKSDVWSFAVTLWEILTFAKEIPYQNLTDAQVMQNISHLHYKNGIFAYLPKPSCPKDIFDLMLECWKRHEIERPSFREIHLFLQRKNLGYAPVM